MKSTSALITALLAIAHVALSAPLAEPALDLTARKNVAENEDLRDWKRGDVEARKFPPAENLRDWKRDDVNARKDVPVSDWRDWRRDGVDARKDGPETDWRDWKREPVVGRDFAAEA
ncbi:hypothetical protein BOTBODRAFT_25997 [Botryobasidium botryosum FD-172 SS1]|uniref:Uncharacterized protein n=1 Tax=Botryobasidium botryosum (strain FD-172 SS1) TaxID=930990 RepID=A0A067N0M3_BOTB1|nr:hypothetical protein BOTBODRAFT_25997 [Botryobasidium botryosum FD-172 SS1]